jgi:aspartyl-tRNA(Asn)/glutamyl-tRNA(Gln) amidotransferase subunit C
MRFFSIAEDQMSHKVEQKENSERLDVAAIARLAHIATPEQELNHLEHRIEETMQLIATMQDLDTSNVAAMAHPLDLPQPTRPDQPTPCPQEQLSASAPHNSIEMGLYTVPQVIE